MTFIFGSCTAGNIIARDQMDTYKFTSAQWLIAALGQNVRRERDYILLEFHGTHDETSHDEERSKKLKYKQIIAIYKAVIVAPNLSATKLRRNLQNASPEKHVQPNLLRSIQLCVRKTRKELTVRELYVCGMVPKSVGQLTEWCESMTEWLSAYLFC